VVGGFCDMRNRER